MKRGPFVLFKFAKIWNFKFQDNSVYLTADTIVIVISDKGNF